MEKSKSVQIKVRDEKNDSVNLYPMTIIQNIIMREGDREKLDGWISYVNRQLRKEPTPIVANFYENTIVLDKKTNKIPIVGGGIDSYFSSNYLIVFKDGKFLANYRDYKIDGEDIVCMSDSGWEASSCFTLILKKDERLRYT